MITLEENKKLDLLMRQKALMETLEDLKDEYYLPEAVPFENMPTRKPDLEYEFANHYTNPEFALQLLIEIGQLQKEIEGRRRNKITTFEEAKAAQKGRLRSMTGESHEVTDFKLRKGNFVHEVIKKPRPRIFLIPW